MVLAKGFFSNHLCHERWLHLLTCVSPQHPAAIGVAQLSTQRRREDMAPQMSKTAAAAAAVAGTAFVALPSQGVDDCGCPADRIFGDLRIFYGPIVPLPAIIIIICPPVFVQKWRIFELSAYVTRSLDVVEVAIALIGAVFV